MIRLIKSSPRDKYARDRNWMIEGACGVLCKTYIRPADSLFDILTLMGWRIVSRPVPGPGLAKAIASEKVITLCSNLPDKLDGSASADVQSLLAVTQQYAHIRLHFYSGHPYPGPAQIEEASLYAGVFLVPRHQILEHPVYWDMVEADGNDLWGHVGHLAQFFFVPRWLMVRELEALNIVIHDRESETLRMVA